MALRRCHGDKVLAELSDLATTAVKQGRRNVADPWQRKLGFFW
jgi:hypothetical protein